MGDAPAAPQANCPPNILQRPLLGCWLLDNWSWRVGGGFGAVSLNVSYLKYPLSKDTQSLGVRSMVQCPSPDCRTIRIYGQLYSQIPTLDQFLCRLCPWGTSWRATLHKMPWEQMEIAHKPKKWTCSGTNPPKPRSPTAPVGGLRNQITYGLHSNWICVAGSQAWCPGSHGSRK